MKSAFVLGALAALGAFAGVLVNGSRLQAADEIRCRVNVEALVQDIAALETAQKKIDSEFVKQLLQQKAPPRP